MSDLTNQFCEPCRSGAHKMTPEEIKVQHAIIPDWEILSENEVFKIKRKFTFKNFQKALDFTNAIGQLAEDEGHHPSILTEWGKTTITLWTHKINGLHLNDFIMAAKIDQL